MQQRDNGGILFKNNRKNKETQPDYQGSCLIGNKPFEIAAWIKQGKAGPFMSLAFKPKTQSERTSSGDFDEDESIPF